MDPLEITPFIRPDQISFLANLPIEILILIEKKLKESCEDALERQREETNFSELCLSTRDTSCRWKEVAVYEEGMGELVKVLKEIRVGEKVESITITAKMERGYFIDQLLPPSVPFGQLMRYCKKLKQLHFFESSFTINAGATLGVQSLVYNGIVLSHLSLLDPHYIIDYNIFLPLFGLDHPSHLVLQDLHFEADWPSYETLLPIPTRFISFEMIFSSPGRTYDLEQFLAPSIGYITDLSLDFLQLDPDEEEESFLALFNQFGTSLTRLSIGSMDLGDCEALTEVMRYLEKLEYRRAYLPILYRGLPRLTYLSVACLPAEAMDGKFLEFIRNPPTALRLIDILPLFDGEYGKIEINTKEFLQEAAKNGNLEIKFPIEWDLKDEKVICDGVEKLQLEGETRRLVGR